MLKNETLDGKILKRYNMKGGRCCAFEPGRDGCVEGLYSGKQNEILYCGMVNDIFLFFKYHAFKHMDEMDLECYNVEQMGEFIRQLFNKPSLLTGRNTDMTTAVSERGEFIPREIYSAFDIDFDDDVCNYCTFNVYEKDVIVVFLVGKCNYTLHADGIITYDPIYSKTINDNTTSVSSRVDAFPSMSIEDQVRIQKNAHKQTKGKKRFTSIIPTVKSQHKTAIPLKKGSPPAMPPTKGSPPATPPTKESPTTPESLIKPSEIPKISKTSKKKTKKKETTSSTGSPAKELPTTPPNLSETIVSSEVPETSKKSKKKTKKKAPLERAYYQPKHLLFNTIDWFEALNAALESEPKEVVLVFEDCIFDDIIFPVSRYVKKVILLSCNNIPKFEENSITELTVIEGNVEITDNLLLWKLQIILLARINKHKNCVLTSMRSLPLLQFYVFDTTISDISVFESWPIQFLCLLFVTITGPKSLKELPQMNFLKDLYISSSSQNIPSMKKIKTLDKCVIKSDIQDVSINSTFCQTLSPEFRTVIKNNNDELTEMLQQALAERSISITIPELKKSLVVDTTISRENMDKSNYLFSMPLIFSVKTQKFICMCSFNATTIINIETEKENEYAKLLENQLSSFKNYGDLTEKYLL